MENNSNKEEKKQISRRGFLPLLGSGLILPLLSFGKTPTIKSDEDDEYQILLKPDGSVVKVKKSVLDKAKVVEKSISNKSLLGWLKNK
jgi:hypothetical protein